VSKIRLLICHTDQTVTPLPWCGEDNNCKHPSCLEPLEYRLGDHQGHRVSLGDIDENLWDNPAMRPSIIQQAVEYSYGPGKAAGLGEAFYDVRSTFKEDAFTCWRQHNRTKSCGDYMSDRMRLYPDTKADRREAGLDPKQRPATTLCQFCPYHAIVVQRQRSEKHRYNYSE
jgi:hypothetical protein